MITGHFGLAAAVKSAEKPVPLWALMLATVWLDIIFAPLFLAGIETIDDVPGTDGGYGDGIIHADYTHSLAGALVIAAVTGWLCARFWNRRTGVVLGAVVFSHWLLDASTYLPFVRMTPPSELTNMTSGFPGTNAVACWSGCIDSSEMSPVWSVHVAPASVDSSTARPFERSSVRPAPYGGSSL